MAHLTAVIRRRAEKQMEPFSKLSRFRPYTDSSDVGEATKADQKSGEPRLVRILLVVCNIDLSRE